MKLRMIDAEDRAHEAAAASGEAGAADDHGGDGRQDVVPAHGRVAGPGLGRVEQARERGEQPRQPVRGKVAPERRHPAEVRRSLAGAGCPDAVRETRAAEPHPPAEQRRAAARTPRARPPSVVVTALVQPRGTVARSDGSTSSAKPSMIDHIASVTTNGWRRSTEMMAPLAKPMPRPSSGRTTQPWAAPPRRRPGSPRWP